jgi:hypothetical protein
MEKVYFVNSNLYNRVHKFMRSEKGNDIYLFVPEQEWMPLYVTYCDKDKNKVKFIDTDGGPNIYVGWTNGEILVDDIFTEDNKMYFKLREV